MVKVIVFNKLVFQYYFGCYENGCDLLDISEEQLKQMVEIMNFWFDGKLKGCGVCIFVFQWEYKFWFVICYGKLVVCEGKYEEDGEIGVVFFWLQKYDVVIYDVVVDFFGINVEIKGEKDLYICIFGDMVFGKLKYFGNGNVFIFVLVCVIGLDVLKCKDIEGVLCVWLFEVVWVISGDLS